MNEDEEMARLNDLYKFSTRHKIKLASIEDLISYRLKYEKLVKAIYENFNYKNIGKVNIYIYKNKLDKNTNFVITKGKFNQKIYTVRVLSHKIKKYMIIIISKIP